VQGQINKYAQRPLFVGDRGELVQLAQFNLIRY
jgi:hypothetical protein